MGMWKILLKEKSLIGKQTKILMKKILSLIFPLSILISGCNLEEIQDPQMNPQDGRIFTTSFEQNETRTYIENGNLLRWNAGDQITIFEGNTLNRKYQFNGETGDNAGTFSIVSKPFGTGNDLNCHYAVYPYSSGVKITESGVITATLPAEQSYTENSFGLGANTMVAVTENLDDTFLKFKNVGGYLKLQLYGENVTIKSITLNGNNNEKLSGKATITPYYGEEPMVTLSDEATQSITLNCGEGIKVGSSADDATAFWIVVPPTSFESGFTITLTDINDITFTQSTSSEITIERNVIKPMKAFEVTIENDTEEGEDSTIPNNEIWYTATAKVEPYYWENVFGANILSNIWDPASGEGIITFDNNVTMVGDRAFYERYGLTSITFPNSVTMVGELALGYCRDLLSVNLGDGVITIGDRAFKACGSLVNIILPCNVTTIGSYAFHNCSSLVSISIPDNVKNLGDLAFHECWSLAEFKGKFASTDGHCLIIDGALNSFTLGSKMTSYTIPENVTTISQYAFYCCHSLTNVIVPKSVKIIDDYAFYNCSGLTYITLPDELTTIGQYSFSYCRKIINLSIPSSVTNIGREAFNECNSITDIIIPNGISTIERGVFNTCSSLINVTIPNSVQTIGEEAFYNCSSLKSITIPDKVVTIGRSAFERCTILEKVYCEAINPPTVIINGFSNCSSTLAVYVPTESLDAYKSADYWKDMNIIGVGDNNDQPSWFNPDQYITYVENHEVIEPNAEDWYEYSSYISCPISPFSKIEMKYEMIDDGSTCYLCCRNRARENTSAIFLNTSGLVFYDEDEDEIRSSTYPWESLNVSKSDRMTLTISFKDKEMSINDNPIEYKMNSLTSFRSGYFFSYFSSENDEGVWRVRGEGVPEGSKLYYVKIWDENDNLVYIGGASKALNPETNTEEYCWRSYYNEQDQLEFAYHPTTHSNYSPYGGGIDQ